MKLKLVTYRCTNAHSKIDENGLVNRLLSVPLIDFFVTTTPEQNCCATIHFVLSSFMRFFKGCLVDRASGFKSDKFC